MFYPPASLQHSPGPMIILMLDLPLTSMLLGTSLLHLPQIGTIPGPLIFAVPLPHMRPAPIPITLRLLLAAPTGTATLFNTPPFVNLLPYPLLKHVPTPVKPLLGTKIRTEKFIGRLPHALGASTPV